MHLRQQSELVIPHYYPYGEEITATANDTYKFAQTYRESDSGLDYARNRYYASGIGRFATADTTSAVRTVPQSWNLYSYALGNPVGFFDPQGRFPCTIDGIAANCCPTSESFDPSPLPTCDPGDPEPAPGGAPLPPPLQCFLKTPTITSNFVGKYSRGIGDLFGAKVQFDYTAGGGTGNYAFSYAQTILYAGVGGNYQNGAPVNGSNVVAGAQDYTYFNQVSNTAQLVDTPGVPLLSPARFPWQQPSPLQTAAVLIRFETDVVVTDGKNPAVCDRIFWTRTIDYSTDSKYSNVSYYTTGGH
jgi:RHS repeat-associated protein